MSNRTEAVLGRVLAAIKPRPDEEEIELALARFLVDHISYNSPDGSEAVLVGSMAKGTFLRHKRDIDIFVLFDQTVPKNSLEHLVRSIMGKAFPTLGYQVSYAEHPYVRFHFEGRRIDLVPAYRISTAAERLSAVDRSVLHTVFVLDSMGARQKGDTLLLKQFLGSSGIYGAEIKIEGFSGYLCELLIIRYGSFIKLLKAASAWEDEVLIDLDGAYKGSAGAKKAHARFGHFVVIDPTDSNRNVAAAVSRASLSRFRECAKSFLKHPSESLFFRKQESFEERLGKAGRNKSAFMVSMPRPTVVDDVLWGQLKKMAGQLKAHLGDFGCSDVIIDDTRHLVRVGIVLRTARLPDKTLIQGPPLKMPKHVTNFKASHRGSRFVKKGGKVFAEARRSVVDAEKAIHQFFRLFSKTGSHLSYPEEIVIVERFDKSGSAPKKKARPVHAKKALKSPRRKQGRPKPKKKAVRERKAPVRKKSRRR